MAAFSIASMSIAKLLRAIILTGAVLAAGACANQENNPDSALNQGRDGKGPVTPGTARDFSVNVGDLVYFSSDSSDLTPEAQGTLQKQAQWLKQYAQYTITIEGHADERGTREYNIALGARRATSVRNFLAQNGINASRLRTISYGKESPFCLDSSEDCWTKNRRAETRIRASTAANGSPKETAH